MSYRLDRSHRDAPLDPALQRALFVEDKSCGVFRAQKLDDFGQRVVRRAAAR